MLMTFSLIQTKKIALQLTVYLCFLSLFMTLKHLHITLTVIPSFDIRVYVLPAKCQSVISPECRKLNDETSKVKFAQNRSFS